MTVFEFTSTLRNWLRLPPADSLRVPEGLFEIRTRIAGLASSQPLNPGVMKILAHGNVSDPSPLTAALGRPPRSLRVALAVKEPASDADRLAPRLFFLKPAPYWSLAFLWIAMGLLSFGLYPVE